MEYQIPFVAPNVELIGSVNESTLDAYFKNVQFSTQRAVYRIDNSSNSTAIIDDTTNATSGTTNAFSPFGTNVIPTTATLKVYDSINGTWASNPLTITLGSINSFKSTGWNKILWGENNSRVAWSPSNNPSLPITLRRYIRIELDDGGDKDSFIVACECTDIVGMLINVTTAGGASTAAKLADVQLIRRTQDIKWVDQTAQAAGSTTSNFVPTYPTFLPQVGLQAHIGFSTIAEAMENYMFRRAGATAGMTFSVEYSKSGGTFSPLSGYISNSNFLQIGPDTTQTTAQKYKDTWTPPADWAKQVMTMPLEGDTTYTSVPLYWLKLTATAVASEAPATTSVARLRAHKLGDSTTVGIKFSSQRTARSVDIWLRGAITGTGAATLALRDLASGDVIRTTTLTIPSTAVQGDHIYTDITDMFYNKLGIEYTSGTRQFADVVITIEE